ncbi:hypothetical protein BH11PLA2_BH11PLA2_04460 [soil metagenome]
MPSSALTAHRLNVDSLEAREVPAALVDGFGTSALYYAPSGWQQWASNNSQYFQVTNSAAASGTQAVAIYGNVNVQSRLWQPEAQSGTIAVSLAVRSDTPAPILLFARGSAINTATPTLVGVSVNSGGVISLRETVSGSDRVLKTITPSVRVNAAWLRVTVELQGSAATVRVQRLDTQQFLTPTGTWQAASTNAISQAVTVTAATGLTGIGRLSGAYGTAYVDDFTATPIVVVTKPTTPPVVTPAPVPPPVVVTPTPKPTPAPTPTPPTTEVRKFEHIRIAQLAYSGLKVTDVEKNLLASSVDLVVANPSLLNTFNTASAVTPQYVYSNVSNIYQELLTDWLGYADTIATNPEAAFYHVSQATAFAGSSASAQPVTWFWDAFKTTATATTDIASALRKGTSSTTVLNGESLAIGGIDEFREVNVTLNKTATAGWAGTWQYASAIDASGKVTAWKTLPLITDGTRGSTVNGRITFNPPTDWKRGSVGNSDPDYYIRLRSTAGTAANAPQFKTILGRDYVNATVVNGTTTGVIPAFDKAADKNSDGYLNDAEYTSRKSGFDARFISESRLFYPYYGQMRFVVNPTSAAVKAWAADYHSDWLDSLSNADGIFLDNSSGKLPFAGTPVLESTTNYSADSAALVAAVKNALGGRSVIANTTGATTEATGIAKAADISFEEFALRPTTVTWAGLLDEANIVNLRLNADPNAQLILDSHNGSTSMTDPRTQMGVLSYYYLVGDPDRTYLMFFGGNSPSSAWTNHWTPAAAVNVGQPKGAMTTFASGADPQNLKLRYNVYSREYDNALVLFKPLSYQLGQGTGTTANATANTHQLNGNYRVLNADGTLGAVVTSITMRNGEGAVLMKA